MARRLQPLAGNELGQNGGEIVNSSLDLNYSACLQRGRGFAALHCQAACPRSDPGALEFPSFAE